MNIQQAIEQLEETARVIQGWVELRLSEQKEQDEEPHQADPERVTYEDLARVMAVRMGSTLDELRQNHRLRQHVYRRAVIAEALYKAGATGRQIGNILNRERTTVINMIQQAARLEFYEDFQTIKQMAL